MSIPNPPSVFLTRDPPSKAYLALKHNPEGTTNGGAADSTFEEEFPSFIASRIRNIRHRPLLTKIPLFMNATPVGTDDEERITGVAFMTALTARAQEEVLMDGMRVFEQGDIVQVSRHTEVNI